MKYSQRSWDNLRQPLLVEGKKEQGGNHDGQVCGKSWNQHLSLTLHP